MRFSNYNRVAYVGYANSVFRITVNGNNLDLVTKVEIEESNYRREVTIHRKTASQLIIEIFALTNGYSHTSPRYEANPTLKFFYNENDNERHIVNTSLPGILPTYNNAGQAWGQCTWYAGYIKMLQNGRTPCTGYSNGFSSLNGDPNNSGFPRAGSILNCSSRHMAYVERVETDRQNNADSSVTFTHTIHISDYNSDNNASFRPDYTTTMVVKLFMGRYTIERTPQVIFNVTGVRQ